jgi:hypothetical protein
MLINSKYLTGTKLKKKTINLFSPMLFGLKNNKILKSFKDENMYYKIFYLIFNHVSLLNLFFQDKKIFYNFSKYFQINLYIYLIKTKPNSIILNLFFHFFYMLFLTFENLEDIYNNNILLKGYKQRFKSKRFAKYWIKPDYGIKYYFKQRINSISSYVLNFNLYNNNNFLQYNNLSSINNKLIYKLFYYFRILQYKLQSFIISYKRHVRTEKTIRIMFARVNCILYKHLNYRLIRLFSFYKVHLKKKKVKNITNVNNFANNVNNKLNEIKSKVILNKPIYNLKKINKINLLEHKKIILKDYKNRSLAQYIFKLMFGSIFIDCSPDLLKNIIVKLNWLKMIFFKNNYNNFDFLKKIFYNFFKKFTIKYFLSNKLTRRFDFETFYAYGKVSIIKTKTRMIIIKKKIRNKFNKTLYKALKFFIINFFNLKSLNNKAQINFIKYVIKKMKFSQIFKTISYSLFTTIDDFYVTLLIIFEQYLNKDFNSIHFYSNLCSINFKKKKRYMLIKKILNPRTISSYDLFTPNSKYTRIHRKIFFKRFKFKKIKKYGNIIHNLIRNRSSHYVLSLNDLPHVPFFDMDDFLFYNSIDINEKINFFNNLKSILKKPLKKKKKNIFLKLKELLKKKKFISQKKYLLKLLSKKQKLKKQRSKRKKYKLRLYFLKKRRLKYIISNNMKTLSKVSLNKILFFKNIVNINILVHKKKLKKKLIEKRKNNIIKKKLLKKNIKIKKKIKKKFKTLKNKVKKLNKLKKLNDFIKFRKKILKEPLLRQKILKETLLRKKELKQYIKKTFKKYVKEIKIIKNKLKISNKKKYILKKKFKILKKKFKKIKKRKLKVKKKKNKKLIKINKKLKIIKNKFNILNKEIKIIKNEFKRSNIIKKSKKNGFKILNKDIKIMKNEFNILNKQIKKKTLKIKKKFKILNKKKKVKKKKIKLNLLQKLKQIKLLKNEIKIKFKKFIMKYLKRKKKLLKKNNKKKIN